MVPAPKAHLRPNFLTVVLDCVRASDFDGASPGAPAMPFVASLAKESIRYPKATSTAPWTIPSHASLFTGRYPWENGVHMLKELRLDASVPTLAGALTRAGYSTFAASANGFICPEMGLVNGFESSTWGDWWERYLRLPTRNLPPRAENFGPTQRLPSGPSWSALEEKAWYLHRFPVIIEILNRFVQQIRYRSEPGRLAISPWIEETVRRWLAKQPESTPTHCFVNLLDAHEPYITDPAVVHSLRLWRRLVSVRMDRTSVLAGRWDPTPEEFQILHELYQTMVHFLDRRLESLVQVYKDLGRWENTALIITSDHGQAFGEHGHLFHGQRVWEPLIRIPMLLRLPGGAQGGKVAKGWTSLIDVAPTLLELAGEDPTGLYPSAHSMLAMIDAPRPAPVLAMGDGIHQMTMVKSIAAPERIADWDRKWIAAYQGDRKVIYDITSNRFHAYDLVADPSEQVDIWAKEGPSLSALQDLAIAAAAQLQGQTATESADVTERLKSWGYL